jgi:hypothetical protein
MLAPVLSLIIVAGSHDSPAPAQRPTHLPPEGIGLIVGGAISMAGGIGLVAAGFGRSCGPTDASCDPEFNRKVGYAGLPFIAVGAALAGAGGHLKRRFDGWRDRRRLRVPKRGNGLFVGGGVLIGFAAVAFAMTPDSPKVGAALGALWTAGGAAMLVGGGVLRHRFGRWRRSENLSLSAGPLARGAMLRASFSF